MELEEIARIKGEVARAFCVKPEALDGRRRHFTTALARHVAMYILRRRNLTLARIGSLFRRHHADVLHACRRVEELLRHHDYWTPTIRALLAEHGTSDPTPPALLAEHGTSDPTPPALLDVRG